MSEPGLLELQQVSGKEVSVYLLSSLSLLTSVQRDLGSTPNYKEKLEQKEWRTKLISSCWCASQSLMMEWKSGKTRSQEPTETIQLQAEGLQERDYLVNILVQ
ncbi:hypothetical protein HispidOSU_020118 [Sigmodon hispidus]